MGGPAVMRDQIRYLADAADLPNVTVQVIPLSTGGNPGLGGPFSILEFEDDAPVVYVESQAGNLYLEKKLDVRRYASTFDLLRAMALPPAGSLALLRRAAEEME
jgi:hypothetical protein